MERFPPDAVSRQLVPSINISLAQMRLIFLGTLFGKRERETQRGNKLGSTERNQGEGRDGEERERRSS